MNPPLYLIDGYSLIYRAYFAFIRRPLTNSRGQNTSAVFGFFSSLFQLLKLRKLVTITADLTPDRRLISTGGHARTLYAELMRNMSTRTSDSGALPGVVERFVSTAVRNALARDVKPTVVIQEGMASLSEMAGGYDYAYVVERYWTAYDTGDEQLKTNAIRWLRAEFTTRTDARKALGVRTIIDDATFYDNLKLTAKLVRLAGYRGLLVCLDELVNLYKLSSSKARNTNYEQILRILNDCLQGNVEGLGFLFGGTPEFLTDTRRGLFSYEALQSRLAENTFAGNGLEDFSGPTIRLSNLAQEDIYILLGKLRHVHARGMTEGYLLPDAGIESFMSHCFKKVGESYFRTPRNTIREFVNLLSILEQNPEVNWSDLIDRVSVATEANPDEQPLPEDVEEDINTPQVSRNDSDDVLTSFRL